VAAEADGLGDEQASGPQPLPDRTQCRRQIVHEVEQVKGQYGVDAARGPRRVGKGGVDEAQVQVLLSCGLFLGDRDHGR